jgi:hypothetical protein
MKIRNILVMLTPLLLLEFCIGSCPDPQPVPFNYTGMETFVPEITFPGEISVKIRLSDTVPWEPWRERGLAHFGFPRAYGLTCEDPYFPVPNQIITGIQIKTLHHISNAFPALSDVSAGFYGLEEGGFLFVKLNDFIGNQANFRARLLHHEFQSRPFSEFRLYLRERVENPTARFVIQVALSDGSSLVDTTRAITITPN